MAQKNWKELFNQESTSGGTLQFDTVTREWDAYLACVEVKVAALDSFGFSMVHDDGSVSSISSGTLPVGFNWRLCVGKDVECDAVGGAIESHPVVAKYRWNVDAGVGGTVRLRVWGVKTS